VLKTRVIPSLLLKDSALVKTVNFKNPKYVGDPINAIRIFNDKEVDELAVIDIVATQKKSIDYQLLTRISKEAFMPLSYGGGIKTCDDIQKILEMGYEKVILNSKVLDEPGFVREASRLCGSQSLVVCVDATKSKGEYRVFDHRTRRPTPRIVTDWCVELAAEGAGEILLQDVDREGGYQGYDTTLIASVCGKLDIPVIALGGAGKLLDFKEAVESGASAVAAGSMFIFHGPYKAVLITYPDRVALNELLHSGGQSS
jgi:cyclase